MPKISFLILSISLVGCSTGLPTPPVKEVRMLDVQNQVCGLYKVIQTSGKPKYEYIQDISLSQCDGSVCLSPVDYKKLESWVLNVREEYTCKRKE